MAKLTQEIIDKKSLKSIGIYEKNRKVVGILGELLWES